MPSMLPPLSYPGSFQDQECSTSTSRTSHGSSENSPIVSSKDVDRMDRKSTVNAAEVKVGSKSGSSSKVGKKSGKKKRRPAGKVFPGKESPSSYGTDENVEEVVLKATAHAQAVQEVKKAVLEIQLVLFHGVKDKSHLQSAGPLLTQSEYSDVVTERSISKQCGYPPCQKQLTAEQMRKGRYRISLHEHKVYDLRETRLFCSADCLVASKTFQSSLQIERDDIMKKEKLIAVIRCVHESGASRLDQNVKGIKDQSVRSSESLLSEVQERQDSGISSFDDVGPFYAIEGYIPQKFIRDWRSNKIAQQSGDAIRHHSELKTHFERIASGNEPASREVHVDKGKSPMSLDERDKVAIFPVPALKSALKKGKTDSVLKRSVSWKDQKKKDPKQEKKDQKLSPRLKELSKFVLETQSRTPDLATARVPSATTRDSAQVAGSSALVSSRVHPAGIAELKINPPSNVRGSEAWQSERIEAAEALATALKKAAGTTLEGEIGSVEAVAMAGLSIVPVGDSISGLLSGSTPSILHSEVLGDPNKVSASSSASIAVRWPRLEPQEYDDLEVTTARRAWHDAPPRNFKVEVSVFGMIWLALEEWISAATIAHIYGKEPQDQDDFVVANGKEFRRQVADEDGISAEISRTFSTSISQVFPDVVQALRLNVPISTLEQTMGRLVRTMTFLEALPAFDVKHWRMIATLLLDSLSVQRMPSIGVHLANNMPLLRKFLDATGTSEAEYDTFRGLLLPLGRLPTFSTMCGG